MLEITEKHQIDKNHDDIVVGIDFGTTNSLIAISQNNQLEIIPIQNHSLIKSADISNIVSVKRLLGKSLFEILNDKILSKLVSNRLDLTSSEVRIFIDKKYYNLPEIVAKILLYLKENAEIYLKFQVKKAVITVPAHFNDTARGQIMMAAKLANLEVVRLLSEPTAAAFCYMLHQDDTKLKSYVIYDLGGGTFDVSILQMTKAVFKVIATGGNNMLGGDDIDNIVASYFSEQYNIPYDDDLLVIARNAKETLSYEENFYYKNIFINIEIFNNLINEIIKETMIIMKQVIADADISNIDGIIIVGGATKTPLIKQMIKKYFDIKIYDNIDPDLSVALGAAIQAENLTNKSRSLLIDVVPLSLGIELYGGLVEKIILRNSSLPCSVTKQFISSIDNQTSIKIHILQGEREMVNDLHSIANFEFNKLPPMKAGSLRLDVTFSIDINNILSVTAFELISGKSHQVILKPTYGLTKEECDHITEYAYEHAKNDHLLKLLKEVILKSESLIYNVETSLNEVYDILTEDELSNVISHIENLRNAIILKDLNQIRENHEKFEIIAQDFLIKKLDYMTNSLLTGKYIN
jgi:molecular chaperone HscA